MDGRAFLDWAISLLEEIEASAEKHDWCENYSVYERQYGEHQLRQNLNTFADCAYQLGVVITNYQQVIDVWGLDEHSILCADEVWLADQPYLCTLACIAYHFRRDHFCEGALINKSIAGGAMLRLLQRLSALHLGANLPTTLETLYHLRCKGVPQVHGIYRVLAPQGMVIQFEKAAPNTAAPLYDANILSNKYGACKDKEILYIGKAGSKSGLRQRLWQYMKYGWNKGTNHKGGRAIWQIKDAGILLLEYECCENCEEQEHKLLKEFRNRTNITLWQTGKDSQNCFPDECHYAPHRAGFLFVALRLVDLFPSIQWGGVL